MTHQVQVDVYLADLGLREAVGNLLAASPRLKARQCNLDPQSPDTFPDRHGAAPAEAKVLLFGPDELVRFDEENQGRIDEMHERTKIVLLLGSDQVRHSMDLLRLCDGMIVRDANLDRISDIIEFALHGYFVIPRHLMPSFHLASAPMRGTIVEQINSRENRPLRVRARNAAAPLPGHEYFASRTTMRNAIRKVLRRAVVEPHANGNGTASAHDNGQTARAKERVIAPAQWRRALRDDEGRVTTLEYVLILAALACWSAIAIEGTRTANVADTCPVMAPSGHCQVRTDAAKLNPVNAKVETAAKVDRQSQPALKKASDERPDEPAER